MLLIYLGFSILSLFIVFIPLVLPKTYYSKQDLINVECGWPFPFTVQDQSKWDPLFPWQWRCFGSPWENPFHILWPQLLFDIVLTFLILLIGFYSINSVINIFIKKNL